MRYIFLHQELKPRLGQPFQCVLNLKFQCVVVNYKIQGRSKNYSRGATPLR